MEALEIQLTEQMLQSAREAETVCGVHAPQEVREIARNGGVRYIRSLAKRGMESGSLCALAEKGQARLSFEACAVRPEYAALFTDDEVNACFSALCAYGYYG